jgi:hypothetical protein
MLEIICVFCLTLKSCLHLFFFIYRGLCRRGLLDMMVYIDISNYDALAAVMKS